MNFRWSPELALYKVLTCWYSSLVFSQVIIKVPYNVNSLSALMIVFQGLVQNYVNIYSFPKTFLMQINTD